MFVCLLAYFLLLNGTSTLFRLLVPRIDEIKHIQQMGVSISIFIAGMGRLNFTYLYQFLQFKMLKKFVLHSTFVVKHLLQCCLIQSDFIEMCPRYDINF